MRKLCACKILSIKVVQICSKLQTPNYLQIILCWSQIWDQSRTPVHFPAMCTSQCTNLLLSFYAEPPLRKGSVGRPFLCVSTVYLLNVPSFSWTALQNCCMNYYNSALISLYVSGKTFLTYLSMKMLLNSDLITSRWHQIVAVWAELNTTIHEIYILHVEKLSGFAKTFQSALLTRWRGFSDSELECCVNLKQWAA